MHPETLRVEAEGKHTVGAGFRMGNGIGAIEDFHSQRSQGVALVIAKLAGQNHRGAGHAAIHRVQRQMGG